jgi:hypothetical protein
MIMDLRQDTGNTTLTNAATIFTDNYVLTQQLYNMAGTEKLNSGSNLTGCNANTVDGAKPIGSTRRFTEEEMIAYIKASMARHKVPRYIEFVEGFPMNAAGKVLKYKMREDAAKRLNLTGDGADTAGPGK